MKHLLIFSIALTLPFTTSSFLQADEIEETISKALESYKAGEFSKTTSNLQYAVNLLSEKKAEAVLKTIPESVGSWKGDEGTTESLGMLGGGISVTRNFTHGDLYAKILIYMDSPMVQQFLGVLANPAFAGQMGLKMRDVHGEKASYNPQSGEISLVVNNSILIKIEANSVPEEDALALARAIDIEALKKLQ